MLAASALRALDEIAFQANLLALQAALESARAGDEMPAGGTPPAAVEIGRIQEALRSETAGDPGHAQAAARLIEALHSLIVPTRPLRPR